MSGQQADRIMRAAEACHLLALSSTSLSATVEVPDAPVGTVGVVKGHRAFWTR
jgi:hypothetical protein